MMATVWHQYAKDPRREYPLQPMAEKFQWHSWRADFPKYGREAFRKHQETVRREAPKDALLEYEIKQGWSPLCEFLGKEVPDVAMPREDAWKSYKEANPV